MGNCLWCLNRPPVSKGLVCSLSLHLLLGFFLVVRRLALRLLACSSASGDSFFIDSVCGFLAIWSDTHGLLDFETFLHDRSQNTNRPTHESLRKKLSDTRKSLHVQSKVVERWTFWEAGFGFLCGAAWLWWSWDRGFDPWRRTITNFRDPSGQKHVGGQRRDTHTDDKVRTHGHTLLFYRMI